MWQRLDDISFYQYTQEEQLMILITLGSRAFTQNNGAKKPNY